MIKTIKAILAPAVITVLLLSCKKDNTGNSEPTLIKNEATKVQVWFSSQPTASTAKLPAATALYANTVTYAGSGITITPMQLAGSTNQAAGKFLITSINVAGEITGGNFYIVLNKTNLSLTNLITPDFLSLGNIPETFTGGIIKYDMAGNMLSSVHIQAGKVMTGQQDILSATKLKPAGGTTPNLAPPPPGQTCTDWYWQHFENGILIWEEYLYTTCEDVTNGGGNNSPGNNTGNVAVDSLKNSLVNSCLKGVFNQITDAKLRNQITTLFQQTYIGGPNLVNYNISENPMLVSPNGVAQESRSWILPPNQNGYTEFKIEINPGLANTSSREYMGYCILHETVHSFVQFFQNKTGVPLTDGQSHQIMFTSWVNLLRDAMKEIFSLSNTDATALALQGMDDILMKEDAYGDLRYKPSFDQFAIANYGMSLNSAFTISTQYEHKTKGVSCISAGQE